MKTGLIAVAAGLFVSTVAFPAMAQGGAEDIARGFVFEAKPGMATQFEEAIKLHVQWRKQNNDPWTWVWYQVVNGDNIGSTWSGRGIIAGRILMRMTLGKVA